MKDVLFESQDNITPKAKEGDSGITVFIKSKVRDTALKIHENKNKTNGKNMNITKMANCRDGIRAQYNTKTGKLRTGLHHMVSNPYESGKTPAPPGFEFLKGQKDMKLQHKKEIEWGLEKDFLTDVPFVGTLKRGAKVTFFQSFVYRLNDGTTVLNLNKMTDDLAYHMFTDSSRVAPSYDEMSKGNYPYADFYISKEHETEEIKYNKEFEVNKAIARLNDQSLTKIDLSKAAQILCSASDEMPEYQIYNLLSDYIKKNSLTNRNIENFNKTFDLFRTAIGAKEIEMRCLLLELLKTSVITERKGTYKWVSKDMLLGYRKDEVIDFMMDANKAEDIDAMKEELSAKIQVIR